MMAGEEEDKTPASKPPEGMRDTNEALIMSITPSINLTPVGNAMVPVPYNIVEYAGHDGLYASSVRFGGDPAMVLRSQMTHVHGDEAGTGGGIISGTHGGIVEPIGHEPTVRAEGSPIIRHGDRMWMNNRNTIGEAVFMKSMEVNRLPRPRPKPSAKDDDSLAGASGDDTLAGGSGDDHLSNEARSESAIERFGRRFMENSGTAQDIKSLGEKAGEYWKDPGAMSRDARALYNSLPTREDVADGVERLGRATVEAGRQVYNDPYGTARNVGGAAVDATGRVIDKSVEIYRKDGVAGLAGAGAGVASDFISPSAKARALKEGAEVAAGIAKRELSHEAREAAEAAAQGRKLEDAATGGGAGGVRVTGKSLEVRCFKKPLRAKKQTFRDQLKEQEDAINKMDADTLLQRRQAISDAGGTGPLRNENAQSEARVEYGDRRMAELTKQGMDRKAADARIAQELKGLDATHHLDIIAGGDPNSISGLGDRSINRSIGSQWKTRAQSLEDHAREMQKAGAGKENL